jgi:hypothetical protein
MNIHEYHKQAEDFLAKYGIAFSAHCTGYEQSRVLPTRRNYVYCATFERFDKKTQRMISVSFDFHGCFAHYESNKKHLPAYYVVSSLTKYNPGMFSDFCFEYDYDEDSRKAFSTYEDVCEEWKKVSSFFSAAEIEEMQEIQ